MEMIGNIVIDDSCYSGNDLYSDGSVEDEMLEIAMQYDESQFNRVIVERKSWPILYHFSHIRANIISGLDISKKDKVLEIGAGCGAVTGALAHRAAFVDAIELSMKRTKINAYRHKNLDNIKIRVGNFQDIEKKLEEKYDMITLIGVFEYATEYIEGENPYEKFLKIIKKHLAPNGRIIIAIENKYGLKYWAGCREDHTGNLFESIEGYAADAGVRTFSKSELTEIIKSAGMAGMEFYYPYPDYKFPTDIYSDEYLPECGALVNNFRNYDRSRITLFDEAAAYDGIISNGLFPFFSNSFLVICSQ